jgi:hypothetical protein
MGRPAKVRARACCPRCRRKVGLRPGNRLVRHNGQRGVCAASGRFAEEVEAERNGRQPALFAVEDEPMRAGLCFPRVVLACSACQATWEPDLVEITFGTNTGCPQCGGWTWIAELSEPGGA